MTLKDKIIHIIDCVEDQDDSRCMDQAADAILTAVREHMTSEDVIQDIGSSLELVGFVHFPDAGADHLRAAILAALGGEP